MSEKSTCSNCSADLTKPGSVIRRYFKRGCYDPDGVFNDSSSIDIEADLCERCGKTIWEA